MDRRDGSREPYGRCLVLGGAAVEAWAATEGRFALHGISLEGTTLRRWLIVYEALLREGMDAESSDKFDDALEEAASGRNHAQVFEDRVKQIQAAGGQVN